MQHSMLKHCLAFVLPITPMLLGCHTVVRAPSTRPAYGEVDGGLNSVVALAYLPTGGVLASAHATRFPHDERPHFMPSRLQVKVWEWLPGWDESMACRLPCFGWGQLALATHDDRRSLLISTSKGLWRWDLDTHSLTQESDVCGTLSPNANVLAVADYDRGAVRLENVASGETLGFIPDNLEVGHPVCFSVSGNVLACINSDANRLTILDVDSQSAVFTLPDVTGIWVALSSDGRLCAVKVGERVEVWDVRSATRLLDIEVGDCDLCAAFSPDGKYLAFGAEHDDPSGEMLYAGKIELWDVAKRQLVKRLIDDSAWGITAVCFSPDGATLTSGDGDGAIKFWRVADLLSSEKPAEE